MPDPSELIFPDEPDFIPPEPPRPTPNPMPRPPMRPPTPPICSIAGTVKNRFGFPEGGARVSLYTSASGNFRPIDQVFTGRLGRFRFPRVRPGRYTLVANSRYRSARRSVSVNGQNCTVRNIDIRL